jgi:hypothetical protein
MLVEAGAQVFIKGDEERLRAAREEVCGNTALHSLVWAGKVRDHLPEKGAI